MHAVLLAALAAGSAISAPATTTTAAVAATAPLVEGDLIFIDPLPREPVRFCTYEKWSGSMITRKFCDTSAGWRAQGVNIRARD